MRCTCASCTPAPTNSCADPCVRDAALSHPGRSSPQENATQHAQLLRRAEHAGTHIGKFSQLIYQRQGETSIRRILGVLSLMKKYGVVAVEDACAAALDIGVYEYRFVRRYLDRRPHPQMFLRQIDPLIRELTVYRDFINLKIKEQAE